MKTQNLILGTFVLLIIAGSVHAASFDCRKATSEVEKLICEDQALSKSDEDLAALYAETSKQAADPLLLKRQQRAWLSAVRDQCIDASSLRDAYARRIKQLSAVLETMSRRTVKTIRSDAEACQVVADFANRGILDNLSVPSEDSQPTLEEIERIFGKDAMVTLEAGLSYWRLDFDNDGLPDHVVTWVEGSAQVSYGYVLSGKKGSAVLNLSDDECYALSVLKVGTRYYVLSHCDGQMDGLWRLSKDGKFKPVCKFAPRQKPMIELVVGKENAVCSQVLLGRVHHVTYSLEHALDELPERNYPIAGLAVVDIDNDGTPDNVVRISFTAGRGCYGRRVAVTDDTRTKIPDTQLNKLLSEQALCRSHLDVFVYEGTTYVDVQDEDETGDRRICLVKGDKVETICEFRGHLLYDVVDVVEESEE